MLAPYFTPDVIEAGCDEAGRGCLAGPVYAAAVILPADISERCPELAAGLNDSKQLTEKKRYELRTLIESEALSWAVGILDNHEIDKFNILRSSIMAMHRALDQLTLRPQHIIVDGNRFYPYFEPSETGKTHGTRQRRIEPIPSVTIVKGDGKYMSIAAASILAKTYRDDCMQELHKQFPVYHWDSNKGYPAKVHRDAIRQYGPTEYHRMTFNLLGDSPQLEFDFNSPN